MKLGQKYKNIVKSIVVEEKIDEVRGKSLNIPDFNDEKYKQIFDKVFYHIQQKGVYDMSIFTVWDIISYLEQNPSYYKEMAHILGVDEITNDLEYELLNYFDEYSNDKNSLAYKIFYELSMERIEGVFINLNYEMIDNKIYREISTPKDIKQVLEYSEKNGLGCCWAKRYDKATAYYGNSDKTDKELTTNDYVLVGELTDKNINWVATLILRAIYEEENEIRLKADVPVKLVKIIDRNTNKRYNVNKFFSSGNKLAYDQYNESKNSLNENVNTQYLYHGMWKDQYEFCKKQNKLFGHSVSETFYGYNKNGERIGRRFKGISTSRNVQVSINFMENIIKEYTNEWKSNPSAIFSKKIGDNEKYVTKDDDLSYVVLVLDYNKIKQNNKIVPLSFLAGSQKDYYGDEQEELIIGDLKNLNNYVVDVMEFNNNINKETIKSKPLEEAFVKNPFSNEVICYYSKLESEVKQIIKNKFNDIPVRVLYDFVNKVYIFGNANTLIHVDLIDKMKQYGKTEFSYRYPTMEKEQYKWMDKNCAMFKIINTNDYKSYTRSDGYKMGVIGKLDTDMYVILRDNTLAMERSKITGNFVPDELQKCKKVPMLQNVKFVKYDIRDIGMFTSKEQLPQKLVNESIEPKLNDNFWKWFGNSKVVDENGNPLVVYHGSGHNNIESFDTSRGTNINAIYFSNKENVASHYSPSSYLKRKTFLNTENVYDEIEKINDVDKLLSILNIYTNVEIKKYSENNWRLDEKGEFESSAPLGKRIDDHTFVSGDGKVRDLIKILKREIIDNVHYSENATVYPCYLSIQYPLIVDAQSKPYWKIEFNGEKVNTETIADYALNNGYDGVIIYNVYETNYETVLCNDYIVFNPNQIKSVDNNGNWSTTSNNINESKEVKLNDNFKKWFGNSKVVDENGNPLVCYHGSPNTFEIFDILKITDNLTYGKGFYFTNDKSIGDEYAGSNGKNYACYIRLINPYIVNSPNMTYEERLKRTKIFRNKTDSRTELIKQGYDGILYEEYDELGQYIEVVAFYPNQIKSVDNNGNWSLNSDNINESASYGGANWQNNMDALGNVPATIGHNLFMTMFPYHFLSLCPKYSYGDDKFFDDYIESKKPIGIPFLIVDFNFDTKTIEVQDHEGRHRVAAISRRNNGNIVDIPVALLYSKNRYPQIPSIEELRKNWTIVSQKGDREYNVGQFSVYNSFPEATNDKWFNLYESIQLNEGIEEVKKYFPKIQDSDFTKLIALDPTYKGGNELGKYGKWILALYNTFLKDKEAYTKWEKQKKLGQNYPQPIRKSQEQIEDFEKLPNLLKDFDVMNTKLRVNINNIKSIADLYKIVNDAKNQGISTNSQVNKGIGLIKKSVEKGGKVVFKDSNWIVLIPETLESSVVFGDDTNWCTTSPNGEMYYGYKNKFGGQYFINLNLQTGELYQFHFESKQFMDKNDNSIEIVPLLNNNISLFNFYKKHFGNSLIGKTTCGIMFVDNPTEEMQMKIIRQDGSAIQYIKNPSEQVQLEVVKRNGYLIRDIDNPTEQVQLEAVKCFYSAIKYIDNPSEKVQLEAVKENGSAIQYINNPSEQVQLEAVKEDGKAIRYIQNPTEKVQLEAIKQHWYTIEYIENPTDKVKALYKKLYGKIYESIQLNEHGINDIKIEIDEILSSNYHQIYFDTYNHIVKIVCNNNKESTYSFDFSKDIDKFNKLCRSLLARFEKNFNFRLTIEQVYNKIEEYNGDSISKNAVHTILKGYYKDFIKSII